MVNKIEFAFCLPEGNITKPSLNTIMGSWDDHDHQAIQIEAIVASSQQAFLKKGLAKNRGKLRMSTRFNCALKE